MEILGGTYLCPKCLQPALEHESLSAEERGECLQCGYFYELTSVSAVSARTKSSHKKLEEKLKELHFHRIGKGESLIRIGYIKKKPETIGQAHVAGTWFSIPFVIEKQETKIQWIELTKDQREEFDKEKWLAASLANGNREFSDR